MKSVRRDQAGIWSPTSTSPNCTLTVIVVPSVPDGGRHPPPHQLVVLVVPFVLAEHEQGLAEPGLPLVPVAEALSRGDDVSWADRHAVGVGLATVHHPQSP